MFECSITAQNFHLCMVCTAYLDTYASRPNAVADMNGVEPGYKLDKAEGQKHRYIEIGPRWVACMGIPGCRITVPNQAQAGA